jgi:hypothetical protein
MAREGRNREVKIMDAQERAELIRKARELASSPSPGPSHAERLYDARQREREEVQRMERSAEQDSGGLPEDEARRVRKWLNEPRVEPAPQTDWWTLIDRRIEEALHAQKEFILEVVANALGEWTAEQSKQDGKQLRADEVRALILELNNTRDEMRELRNHLPGSRPVEARAAH